MNDFHVLHDAADREWATTFENALRKRLTAWSSDPNQPWTLDRVPAVHRREGLDQVPDPMLVGPLGFVLLVTPGRAFLEGEREAIARYRAQPGAASQILPVSSGEKRNKPPEPLNEVVSFKLHDLNDEANVRRLVVWLLNQVGLRASVGDRKIFISYRASDGKPAAFALAKRLRDRGYEVFRDEDRDQDDVPRLPPNVKAQDWLHKEIQDHSILLLIDSPEVTVSEWVKDEVDTALNYLRTIVPIVIQYPPHADGTVPKVPRGGRFRELRELDIEVRVGHEALQEATVAGAFDDATLDLVERVMLRELLGQIRIRKTIEQAAWGLFKKTLGYNWRVIKKDRLLFEVEQRREGPLTPGLRLRFLLLCWPYASVLGHAVKSMTELIRGRARKRHCQYGLMIYSDSFSSVPNKLELLEKSGGDLMVLDLHEVEIIPWMIQSGGGQA